MLSRRELLLLLALFVASLPAVTARLYSSDEVEYFSYLRSLWFDHDVSFENEYRYFYDHRIAQTPDFHQTFLELRNRDRPADQLRDHRVRDFVGAVLCGWRPRRLARCGAMGRAIEADGYSQPYVSAVAYGSTFYGFAAIVLAIAVARQIIAEERDQLGTCRLAGNAAALLYVCRAAVFACLFSVCRRALRDDLAEGAPDVERWAESSRSDSPPR